MSIDLGYMKKIASQSLDRNVVQFLNVVLVLLYGF